MQQTDWHCFSEFSFVVDSVFESAFAVKGLLLRVDFQLLLFVAGSLDEGTFLE